MGKGVEKVLCSVPGCGEEVLARGLCSSHYNAQRYKAIRSGNWSPRKKGLKPVLDSDESFAVDAILRFRKEMKLWGSGEELLKTVSKTKRKMLIHGIWKLFERGVIRYGLYPSCGMNRLTLAGMFEGREVPKKEARPMLRLPPLNEEEEQEAKVEGREARKHGRRGSVLHFPRRTGGGFHRRPRLRDPGDPFGEALSAKPTADFEIPFGDAIEDLPDVGDR